MAKQDTGLALDLTLLEQQESAFRLMLEAKQERLSGEAQVRREVERAKRLTAQTRLWEEADAKATDEIQSQSERLEKGEQTAREHLERVGLPWSPTQPEIVFPSSGDAPARLIMAADSFQSALDALIREVSHLEEHRRQVEEERQRAEAERQRLEVERRQQEKERRQRAEAERQRLEAEHRQQEEERQQRAEAERQRLEAERRKQEEERRQRAEAERQRLEAERRKQDEQRQQRAEAERQRLEAERQRLEAERRQIEDNNLFSWMLVGMLVLPLFVTFGNHIVRTVIGWGLEAAVVVAICVGGPLLDRFSEWLADRRRTPGNLPQGKVRWFLIPMIWIFYGISRLTGLIPWARLRSGISALVYLATGLVLGSVLLPFGVVAVTLALPVGLIWLVFALTIRSSRIKR